MEGDLERKKKTNKKGTKQQSHSAKVQMMVSGATRTAPPAPYPTSPEDEQLQCVVTSDRNPQISATFGPEDLNKPSCNHTAALGAQHSTGLQTACRQEMGKLRHVEEVTSLKSGTGAAHQ